MTVRGDSGSGEYIVSGIYSCANDMGDNFVMNREGYFKIGRDHPNFWCWYYFLADSSQKGAITEALESAYGGDIHVHENTWPGLFGIISAMQALLVLMYALVIVFILIVTVMTGSKILLAEQKDLGIYKAIGFSSASLRLTFALRFAMVAVPGGLIGTLLAAVINRPDCIFCNEACRYQQFCITSEFYRFGFAYSCCNVSLCFFWLVIRRKN